MQSKVLLVVGILLIVCAGFSVLGVVLSVFFEIVKWILLLIMILVGVGLVQAYFSRKNHKKRQEFYLRNNDSSVFVTITSNTDNIPVINIDKESK
ncbi:hypothetical protein FACS1894125_3360 [Actinomycetota bacterium]|nr:hypothetical protein FACS1894125_3360 [Actinomycetota bacterium]